MEKEEAMTAEGLEKLKAEIDYLSRAKRREVAERIKEARDFGDISENSEYDDAKNEQAMLEARIAHLEERLRRAKVIDPSALPADRVEVGATVRVKDVDSKKEESYQIVGSAEADPKERRLSYESPVGKALLGSRQGEVVTVSLPGGRSRQLRVVKIDS